MTKCSRCGSEIPRENGVKFCPNCGSPVSPPGAGLEMRIAVFVVTLMLCIIVTATGAFAWIDVEEAQTINRELDDLREAVKAAGLQVIFGNNFMHALIMFTPAVGPSWGFYVLYNTGRAIAALSTLGKTSPALLMFTLFIFPFTWMEYISYSLAISESFFLAYSIFKRNLKGEFAVASKIVVLCSIILLAAAFIEFSMITLLE